MLQLAKNIKTIRKAARLTQPEFGKFFNASKDMIINYELGRAKPDDFFVKQLSHYTGLPPEDLLDTDIDLEKLNVKKVYNVFHSETVSRETKQNQSDLQELYIQSLRDQIKLATEQNDFLRRNFEFSLKSIALAAHSTNAQVKTLTWFQAYTQAGGDPKKTAKVMDTLNNKMAEYSAVGDEMGIAKNS